MNGVRHSNGQTDAELMQAAKVDEGAFAELYGRHVSTVHAWFRRRLEWAASDLTAETFAQAWLSRGSFRDEAEGSALPWLFGIAHNVARESARRNAVETRARRRLGLSTDLASDDGYSAVEERLSPAGSRLCRNTSVKRSSCASLMNCRTSKSQTASAFVQRLHVCESRGRSGAFLPWL